MPSNIRPPPDSTLFHYPEVFDLEIEFQLRERNPTTLEKMQNIVVDVEVHFLIKKPKLKAEVEHNKISKVKLDILIRKIEEMIQKITMQDNFFVQDHHDTFISQKEEVDSHEQILANSNYNSSENGFTDQYVEEDFTDLICMFYDIPHFNYLHKYD